MSQTLRSCPFGMILLIPACVSAYACSCADFEHAAAVAFVAVCIGVTTATRKEMADANISLAWRDSCAGLLIKLNKVVLVTPHQYSYPSRVHLRLLHTGKLDRHDRAEIPCTAVPQSHYGLVFGNNQAQQ